MARQREQQTHPASHGLLSRRRHGGAPAPGGGAVQPTDRLALDLGFLRKAHVQDARRLLAAVGVLESEPGPKDQDLGLAGRQLRQAALPVRDQLDEPPLGQRATSARQGPGVPGSTDIALRSNGRRRRRPIVAPASLRSPIPHSPRTRRWLRMAWLTLETRFVPTSLWCRCRPARWGDPDPTDGSLVSAGAVTDGTDGVVTVGVLIGGTETGGSVGVGKPDRRHRWCR